MDKEKPTIKPGRLNTEERVRVAEMIHQLAKELGRNPRDVANAVTTLVVRKIIK